MIYWFTGQPSSGKTTLAKKLKKILKYPVKMIDGDDLRDLISNKDYTIKGRVYNVDIAQKIAHYSHNQGEVVIVSLVSPYLDQREEFKALLGDNIKEFYIHTTDARERDHFHVEGYQPPRKNYTEINTNDSLEQSVNKMMKAI
tara:strand:- start:2220 stop:2648 length:429 start_codon:yes stop_codon:yes gene_type:complete